MPSNLEGATHLGVNALRRMESLLRSNASEEERAVGKDWSRALVNAVAKRMTKPQFKKYCNSAGVLLDRL